LRLTTSAEPLDELPVNPAAARFAAFTPMCEQPGLADRKATFVIGAGGLLLSTTLFLITPLRQYVRPEFWPALTLVLAFTLACVTLAGVRIAYRCYTLPVPVRPANPLFFQNIVADSLPAYAQSLRAATDRDVLRDVLDYNHTMAKLGAVKFRLAGQALLCLRVAIPLWMLLLVVITVRAAW
jgi:hypothetical protein